MTRKLVCSLFAACACVLAGAGPSYAWEPRVTDSFFGVSAPELWDLSVQSKHATRDAQLDGMKAAGVDWVRSEIGWPEVEPTAPLGGQHSYSWAAADRFVEALSVRDMELLAMPMATPGWAASPDGAAQGCGRRSEVAQSRLDDYAAFVEAIALRYGPSGSFWASRPDLDPTPVRRYEIWNEPNWNGFWCPEPDPELFASLLKGAADRIHAVDPQAEVIFGGFAALQDSRHEGETLRGMAVDEFLTRAVAHEPGLAPAVDSVAFHPYDLDPDVNLSMLGWLRSKLEATGFQDAEILLTEYGWRGGLGSGALSEPLRASNYATLTGMLPRTDCGVSAVAPHTWNSAELNLSNPDHWWGIASPVTGLLHPSGQAYREQVALYEGRGPTPAPRALIEVCGAPEQPDQDRDGTPDSEDDYPTDPDRTAGSGEEPPAAPEEVPAEPRVRAPRVEDDFFGATLVRLPDDFTRLGEEFGAMAANRIDNARIRINWSQIEPVSPGSPDYTRLAGWSWLDRIVLKMGGAGIRLTPAFGSAPNWVSPSGAAFDSAYADFMRRFAKRYGRGGTFWSENRHLPGDDLAVRDYEVWQYGNLSAHAPDGVATPADYGQTYLAARSSIRGWDPSARVVASLGELGTGGRAGDFIRAMTQAAPALGGRLDAVSIWAEHSRTIEALDTVAVDVRRGLDDSGSPAAPMRISFGAPVRGPQAITESARAELFDRFASRAARSDCGIDGIFAHAWTTPESDPSNSYEWFGIADKLTAEPSATAIAYSAAAAAYTGRGEDAGEPGAVLVCDGRPPDRDGDGTPDPADPAPLDPQISTPTASPPPAPTIGQIPSPTSSRSVTVSLGATGATSFQCKLDSGRFASCGSNPTFTGLAHGPHELRVRAVDALGLVGAEAARSWTVDVVGPEITSVDGPNPVSLDSRVVFTFSSDDAQASSLCQLDGHPWEACSSPKVYGFIGDGAHDFRVKGTDPLGNTGPLRLTQFEVRTTPGIPSLESGPPEAGLAGASPEFSFAAEYSVSFECRFDQAEWRGCSGAGSHRPEAALPEGDHSFEVRAVGGTGKRSLPVARGFSVDATGPKTRLSLSRQTRRTTTFAIKANDAAGVSGSKCSLDRGKFKPCRAPHRVRGLRRGRHSLTLRARDSVGNISKQTIRWRIRRRG